MVALHIKLVLVTAGSKCSYICHLDCKNACAKCSKFMSDCHHIMVGKVDSAVFLRAHKRVVWVVGSPHISPWILQCSW